MTTRQELLTAFDELLQPARFKDYGPNGLQVEGRSAVRHTSSRFRSTRRFIFLWASYTAGS